MNENKQKKIHYLAVDSSPRLLREHINLLKEGLASYIQNNRIICVGIVANFFYNLSATVDRARNELVNKGLVGDVADFIPNSSSLLVTYFGNCLGNYYQDQEAEIFSIVYSTFSNRPLEFLVGVSVKRNTPDIYKKNWDDFLLQTPKHLLEINNLLGSEIVPNTKNLPEFNLPKEGNNSDRCPAVVPEPYIVRHGICGQIYRFYYKLAYGLKLSSSFGSSISLPAGSLILLYNIVKYDLPALVSGIEACGLFKIKYKHNYHQIVDTKNGKREYAVFSAYLS